MENIVRFPTKQKLPDYVEKAWLDEVSYFEDRFVNTNFPIHLRSKFINQYRDVFKNLVQMDIEVIVFDEDNPDHYEFLETQQKMIEQIFAYRTKVVQERRLLELRLFVNAHTGR